MTFNTILASQKCIFDKNGLTYWLYKNKRYYKNYFVKEASSSNLNTIFNFCGINCHIRGICPLRKSPNVVYGSKSFWILNERKANPLGLKKRGI